MTKKDKLIKKFMEKPPRKDLTYQELETILLSMGYNKAEGSGSRAKFYRSDGSFPISIHKPHPGTIPKIYVVREIQNILRRLTNGIS